MNKYIAVPLMVTIAMILLSTLDYHRFSESELPIGIYITGNVTFAVSAWCTSLLIWLWDKI
jgi:hypothetical protein